MTTWELATEEDKARIKLLIAQLRRAGVDLPPFPTTARDENLEGLTRKDAGTLTTLLREAIEELDR